MSLSTVALLGGAVLGATSAQASTMTVSPQHAIPGLCNFTNSEPVVSFGSTGTAVKQAQCELNHAFDVNITVDGDFGAVTRTTTENFQSCAGLAVDGVIGPKTWAVMDRDNARSFLC
jgi:peptidoglycan hydrolase-like protein with peptidoglycan-binding domain